LGLGLRPRHHAYLFEHWPEDVDYFEIISENFMTDAARPRHNLARVRSRYPIVLHGVGLDLLGHAPLDDRYLDALARLADSVDAPFVSDHVCWSGAHGARHHDLLPTPYTEAVVEFAAERAARVQARLGRPFALENLSSYVEFTASTMTEHEFYTRIVTQAGCWFMLDINNVYVSSVNHGFDPLEYLDAIDLSRVVQVHLAGHRREADGLIVDTHDTHVCDDVWRLYAAAWRRGGPFPTLLEWDAAIPDMPVLLAELERGRALRRELEERGE
jgi:uncharacterized protein (UPF0276 family)